MPLNRGEPTKPGTLLVDPSEPTNTFMVISSIPRELVAVCTSLHEVYRWQNYGDDGWTVAVKLCTYSRKEGVEADWMGVPITWYPRPTEDWYPRPTEVFNGD